MKIDNYNRKLEEEKTTGGKLCSDPHIIQGFKMRLEINLNGSGDGTGTHLSVYWQLMKGELDDCLEWPFDQFISFVLNYQDNKSKCCKLSITDALENEANPFEYFRKRVTDYNEGWGFASFLSHEALHADGFIKNDRLYIRCIIE